MTRAELLKTLEAAKDEVRERYKAEIKMIFGSYARGEEKAGSDLDALAEFLEGATLFDLAGLGDFLERKLHCKVGVLSQRALRDEIKPYVYDDLIELI